MCGFKINANINATNTVVERLISLPEYLPYPWDKEKKQIFFEVLGIGPRCSGMLASDLPLNYTPTLKRILIADMP